MAHYGIPAGGKSSSKYLNIVAHYFEQKAHGKRNRDIQWTARLFNIIS
jgi:hypothetical protein